MSKKTGPIETRSRVANLLLRVLVLIFMFFQAYVLGHISIAMAIPLFLCGVYLIYYLISVDPTADKKKYKKRSNKKISNKKITQELLPCFLLIAIPLMSSVSAISSGSSCEGSYTFDAAKFTTVTVSEELCSNNFIGYASVCREYKDCLDNTFSWRHFPYIRIIFSMFFFLIACIEIWSLTSNGTKTYD